MLTRVAEITSEKLTAAVKEFCGSAQAGQSLQGALDGLEEFEDARQQNKPLSISSRTARTWLQKLGLNYGRVGKGIYKDGHEREDVKKYRQEVFAPSFCAHLKNSVQFDEDGNMKFPENVQQPIVFVTHDEAYFNANDATSFTWGNEDLQPIRPKGRGKGIMVSEFLTPAGRLSCQSGDQGRQYASRLIEPGAGKEWWTNTMMIDQLKDAVGIFKKNFPGCTGVWLFDNSTNHGAFSPDALSSARVAMNPGGKQPRMRDGFIGSPCQKQTMVFGDDHPFFPGQPKGAREILRERGLWREGTVLKCKDECAERKDCCARAILDSQPDFRAQQSQIEEYLASEGQITLFYPKFHCDCNWIERYWSNCKRFTRDNCTFNITGLRKNVPAAMRQVTTSTIYRCFNKCARTIQAYGEGNEDETRGYQERAYRSHRRLC